MRIVHVDSAREWRGGQNQVFLAARGMAARGHAVTVVCERGQPLERRCREAGLAVVDTHFSGDLSPAAISTLAGLFRLRGPEVVQLHDPHAVAAGVVAARLAGSRARLVATRRVDFALKGPLSRAKYRACDEVVAVSDAIRRVLVSGGLPPGRLRVVHEGVPDRPARPGGRETLGALGVPAEARVVGNVAAMVDHKDQATLLAAFAAVAARDPRAHLVILGDGPLRGALHARATAPDLTGRVTFGGFRDDLDALVPAFDVFCLSSHMEGLGTSLLDAMCFARPIVGTAAGGIPEAVVDGETGRVVPVRDPAALAAALGEVLGSDALAARLGAAGRRRFEEHFTDDRMVEASLAVYSGAWDPGARAAGGR